MANNAIFRVTYGFKVNNKSSHDSPQVARVLATAGDENTLRTVLANNGIVRPGATIDILAVSVEQHGGSNVLS